MLRDIHATTPKRLLRLAPRTLSWCTQRANFVPMPWLFSGTSTGWLGQKATDLLGVCFSVQINMLLPNSTHLVGTASKKYNFVLMFYALFWPAWQCNWQWDCNVVTPSTSQLVHINKLNAKRMSTRRNPLLLTTTLESNHTKSLSPLGQSKHEVWRLPHMFDNILNWFAEETSSLKLAHSPKYFRS